MQRFTDRTVLITGGAGGMGTAAASRFLSEGAKVAIADVSEESLQSAVDQLSSEGEVIPVQVDVTDPAQVEHMVKQTVDAFGRLDVVFANAGVSDSHLVQDMPFESWNRVISINLTGVFLTCQAAVRHMIPQGGGAIVNMSSSMAEWDTSSGGASYMASKAGVSALTKSLALQVGRNNIRVNAVCPGVIQTNLSRDEEADDAAWERRWERFSNRIPTGRVGQPEDVAATVAFLASDDARHISGSLLLIDGGQTLQSWSNSPDGNSYPDEGNW